MGVEGSEEIKQAAVKEVEKYVGVKLEEYSILKIRQTASSTTEFCVAFRVPKQIAYMASPPQSK